MPLLTSGLGHPYRQNVFSLRPAVTATMRAHDTSRHEDEWLQEALAVWGCHDFRRRRRARGRWLGRNSCIRSRIGAAMENVFQSGAPLVLRNQDLVP